jgi:hypothetical protein
MSADVAADHDAIVNEIRSAQITASPERASARRGLAAAALPPRRRGRGGAVRRRWTLVLVPAAIAVALAASLAIGLADSGKKEHLRRAAASSSRSAGDPAGAPSPARPRTRPGTRLRPPARRRPEGRIPATQGRAQLYETELTLKVKDLSSATKRALPLTRDFHGYVRSVDYGSGSERGQPI